MRDMSESVSESRRKLAADAWGALLQVHAALVPALDRRVRLETGLPVAWYDVLLELSGAPRHRLRISELAERVVLSRSRVSRIVDDLAAAGLVCKEGNPDDRRSAYAVITEEGTARFRRAAPSYLDAIESDFAAHLTVDDLANLKRVLLTICADHLDRPASDR